MTTLPRTCPVGFRFEWNGDVPLTVPRVWTFVGRGELGMPRFESDDDDSARWSMRLEAVAAEAWDAVKDAVPLETPVGLQFTHEGRCYTVEPLGFVSYQGVIVRADAALMHAARSAHVDQMAVRALENYRAGLPADLGGA